MVDTRIERHLVVRGYEGEERAAFIEGWRYGFHNLGRKESHPYLCAYSAGYWEGVGDRPRRTS